MKNINFRLQKVLDVREGVEKERQKNLAISKRKLEDEQNKLTATENKKNDFIQNINNLKKATVSKIYGHYDFFLTLVNKTSKNRNKVESLENEVEQKRQTLLVASKDKKILEKLKDKKIKEYIKSEDKKAQSIIDEIALRSKKVIK